MLHPFLPKVKLIKSYLRYLSSDFEKKHTNVFVFQRILQQNYFHVLFKGNVSDRFSFRNDPDKEYSIKNPQAE